METIQNLDVSHAWLCILVVVCIIVYVELRRCSARDAYLYERYLRDERKRAKQREELYDYDSKSNWTFKFEPRSFKDWKRLNNAWFSVSVLPFIEINWIWPYSISIFIHFPLADLGVRTRAPMMHLQRYHCHQHRISYRDTGCARYIPNNRGPEKLQPRVSLCWVE